MARYPVPRMKITIRGLMIAVAISAVFFAGGVWHLGQTPRATACRRIARLEASYARAWAEYAALSDQGLTFIAKYDSGEIVLHPTVSRIPLDPVEPNERARIAAICRTRAAYHEQLKQKWLRAARHPWESLAPDPPPPYPINDTAIKYVVY
jgi:hypothetical protein